MRLINFDDTRTEVEVDESAIKYMAVAIVSGDELLYVRYKDGTEERINSCNIRIWDLFDALYLVDKSELKYFIKAEQSCIDAEDRMKEFLKCKKNSLKI